jgi:uridine kinase
MNTKKIKVEISQNKKNNGNKPVLVVICGGSGSGKTTVAKLITQKIKSGLSSCIVSLDNFYLPSYKIKTDNFDIPEALDWDLVNLTLAPLLERKATKCPIYSFIKRDYTEFKEIKPCDVIIVEGILSLTNQQLRDQADIKIYVEVPDDERLIRRLLRDISERGTDIKQTIDM